MDKELEKTIEEKSKKLAMSDKLVRKEKKVLICALYLMFYKGKPKTFAMYMGLSQIILDTWLKEYMGQATEMLDTYKDRMKKDIMEDLGISDDDVPAPTASSIKAKILNRLYDSVQGENDPAKLASALKILDKYDKDEKEVKKSKTTTIYDDLKNIQ
jgi:hypothetical protein